MINESKRKKKGKSNLNMTSSKGKQEKELIQRGGEEQLPFNSTWKRFPQLWNICSTNFLWVVIAIKVAQTVTMKTAAWRTPASRFSFQSSPLTIHLGPKWQWGLTKLLLSAIRIGSLNLSTSMLLWALLGPLHGCSWNLEELLGIAKWTSKQTQF